MFRHRAECPDPGGGPGLAAAVVAKWEGQLSTDAGSTVVVVDMKGVAVA